MPSPLTSCGDMVLLVPQDSDDDQVEEECTHHILSSKKGHGAKFRGGDA